MRTWQESLNILREGNARFIQHKMNNVLHHDLQTLSEAQNPYAVILCCSDSRVSPDIIFDQSLGSLFVIQNAGNVSDTSVLGSIQYAIQHLNTPLIIVLGHTCCGAVTAAHENKKMKGPLQDLITQIDENLILNGTAEDSIRNHTLATARLLNTALETHQAKIEQDAQVLPAVYDIASGYITWMDLEKDIIATPQPITL
ncbi:carbonic anhydrase [Acinetobacter chinensis]|uniref:Carbonic anhydrase n=1 Tax=Acinetobacter chinensis TaxID=2004650 RepID=A0ABU3WCH6_9GAMM|nr:carbonic anhydrase [Acinetobacter chinensis]MDV2468105.1 carbonic anhydrase [Acinetobacter chinensis]